MKKFPGNLKIGFTNALMQPPQQFAQMTTGQNAEAELNDLLAQLTERVDEHNKKTRREWLDLLNIPVDPDPAVIVAQRRQQEETARQEQARQEQMRIEGVVQAFRGGVPKAILAPDRAIFTRRYHP